MSGLPDVRLVVITPDSSEIRWVSRAPDRGERMHGRFHGTWIVVDDVFQSGATTYTVFASTAPDGLLDQAKDLAVDAIERVQESVKPQFGQSRPRHHLP